MTQAAVTIVSEEEWLASRQRGIGASDVARVFTEQVGELTLWAQKTGKEEVSFPPILSDYGNALEAVLVKHLNIATGLNDSGEEYRQAPPGTRFRLEGEGPIFTTPDFIRPRADWLTVGVKPGDEIECGRGDLWPFCEGKTCDRIAEWKWDHGPDLYAMIQTQATMLASRGAWTTARVAVLVGNGYSDDDFRVHEVEEDRDLQGEIFDWSEYFWECVKSDTPPAVDHLRSTLATIRLLYPAAGKESRRQGVLPSSMMDHYREMKRQKGISDAAYRIAARHRAEIEFAMAEAGLEDATIAATEADPNPPRFLIVSFDRPERTQTVKEGHVQYLMEVKK